MDSLQIQCIRRPILHLLEVLLLCSLLWERVHFPLDSLMIFRLTYSKVDLSTWFQNMFFFLGISHFSLHFPGVFCFSVRQVLSQVQREADVALILKLKCARRRDGVVFGGKNRSRFAPLQKRSGRRLLCFCLMYCTILYKYVLVYVQTCTCLLFLELLRLFSWWFSSNVLISEVRIGRCSWDLFVMNPGGSTLCSLHWVLLARCSFVRTPQRLDGKVI